MPDVISAAALAAAATALIGGVTVRITSRIYDREVSGFEAKFVERADEELLAVDEARRVVGALATERDTARTQSAVEEVRDLLKDALEQMAQAQERPSAVLPDEYHAQGLAQSKIAFRF